MATKELFRPPVFDRARDIDVRFKHGDVAACAWARPDTPWLLVAGFNNVLTLVNVANGQHQEVIPAAASAADVNAKSSKASATTAGAVASGVSTSSATIANAAAKGGALDPKTTAAATMDRPAAADATPTKVASSSVGALAVHYGDRWTLCASVVDDQIDVYVLGATPAAMGGGGSGAVGASPESLALLKDQAVKGVFHFPTMRQQHNCSGVPSDAAGGETQDAAAPVSSPSSAGSVLGKVDSVQLAFDSRGRYVAAFVRFRGPAGKKHAVVAWRELITTTGSAGRPQLSIAPGVATHHYGDADAVSMCFMTLDGTTTTTAIVAQQQPAAIEAAQSPLKFDALMIGLASGEIVAIRLSSATATAASAMSERGENLLAGVGLERVVIAAVSHTGVRTLRSIFARPNILLCADNFGVLQCLRLRPNEYSGVVECYAVGSYRSESPDKAIEDIAFCGATGAIWVAFRDRTLLCLSMPGMQPLRAPESLSFLRDDDVQKCGVTIAAASRRVVFASGHDILCLRAFQPEGFGR